MRAEFRPALVLLGLLTLVTGVLYPLLVTALGAVMFPAQAGGSLIRRDGHVVGSALVGQPFAAPGDFWPRPSATAAFPYDASASAASNLGPLHPALLAQVRTRIALLRAADPGATGPVPADLVTTSASGLDPHISPAAAEFQAERVARARGLDPAAVRALVARRTEGRTFGLLGEPRVNVLELNLALDSLAAARRPT